MTTYYFLFYPKTGVTQIVLRSHLSLNEYAASNPNTPAERIVMGSMHVESDMPKEYLLNFFAEEDPL